MKYRKKPVVVEAMQYTKSTCGAVRRWLSWAHSDHISPDCGRAFFLRTLEGEMTVQPGDWIIRGVKGEFYPCKPDIFEQTYEPVEED